jgi:hypothetical protein
MTELMKNRGNPRHGQPLYRYPRARNHRQRLAHIEHGPDRGTKLKVYTRRSLHSDRDIHLHVSFLSAEDLNTQNSHQSCISKRRQDLESDFHQRVAQHECGWRVSRAGASFVQVQIAICRKDGHGVQESDKRDGSGVFDSEPDPVLSTGRTSVESLKEEQEEGAEEGCLEQAIEEYLITSADPDPE